MNARSHVLGRRLPHASGGWAPPTGTIGLTVGRQDVISHRSRHFAWVSAEQLARLAERPDAAVTLRSRRGYLPDSPENQRLADLLRRRPEDFGAAGEPIVLGADHVNLRCAPGDWQPTLELHGAECLDGFQRLVVMAHALRELGPAHLGLARVRIEVVTGAERDRARLLSYETHRYANAPSARDNLSRCPELGRVRAEYEREGGYFDPRRGVVAGPHPCAHGVADVFRALACFSTDRLPDLAHRVSTESGLHAVWSDIEGPEYRSLMNGTVHAWSVQRAVEAYDVARQVTRKLDTSSVKGHAHLIRYAPDLVAWAAGRSLPLRELHADGRGAPEWDQLIRGAFAATVADTARRLVEAYRAIRPYSDRFKSEVARPDIWTALVERGGWAR
ncbi:hypothetical protein [Streptomyces sp. SP18CS02]|uniref:hypothetical protein n=1 Tax=Streptomyces sp. SP18CS02 TaxID=3002531 RepID=UPI002E78A175|nr:hypothetical protein [Streptomyces sp. SP18CS02]MEE1753584.1 hypothetical protein [Streptomyces sp. SP18CS02]